MGNGPGTMGLGLASFIAVGTAMMAAMMLPAVAPVGALYLRTIRARATGWARLVRTGAFLAGYIAARYSGRQAPDCLAYGVACGAEATQHLGAGVVDPQQVARLLADVEVERLQTAEVG